MSIFIEVYPCNPITKHEFLALHFIIVLIGFHGNLENVYRLFCDQAASTYLQNTHQVLGGYKRNSVQPQRDKKDFFIYQARDGGHSSLPLDLSSLSARPLFLFYKAGLRKYWLHE